MKLIHHGGAESVTGSCHELVIDHKNSVLVDCGLFQGNDFSTDTHSRVTQQIDFPVDRVQALLVTHCHLDHVGRIPYLLAAGFSGQIYCTEATATLLPLVLEDALKIGFTRDRNLIKAFLRKIDGIIVPVPYKQWVEVISENKTKSGEPVTARFQPAGHILGSAYLQISQGKGRKTKKVVFSGDLGAPYTPLLPSPKSPYTADLLVLESTYGDRLHQGRKERRKTLRSIIKHCFRNRGTVLIPAFSIGRTQELLYEIETIIHQFGPKEAAAGIPWEEVDVIVDSPLASRFTEVYRELKTLWDREAKRRVTKGRHPLSFEQLLTIGSHEEHQRTVEYLKQSGRPAIVIAASGMCSGGRIVNYLKSLIEDPRTDILLVGYQARGTPGRIIQKYGPEHGYVKIDGKNYDIQAGVYTISGYSAHADQQNLLRFVKGMRKPPREIRLVHGEKEAKAALRKLLRDEFPSIEVC